MTQKFHFFQKNLKFPEILGMTQKFPFFQKLQNFEKFRDDPKISFYPKISGMTKKFHSFYKNLKMSGVTQKFHFFPKTSKLSKTSGTHAGTSNSVRAEASATDRTVTRRSYLVPGFSLTSTRFSGAPPCR